MNHKSNFSNEIRRASNSYSSGELPWLANILKRKGLDSSGGILTRISSAHGVITSIWLTNTGDFFEIEADPTRSGTPITSFKCITSSIMKTANDDEMNSFGYQALQILKEKFDNKSPFQMMDYEIKQKIARQKQIQKELRALKKAEKKNVKMNYLTIKTMTALNSQQHLMDSHLKKLYLIDLIR